MRHQGVFSAMGLSFAYDAWLTAPAVEDEEKDRAEWIENRAYQLMQDGQEFDPETQCNASEAFSELSMQPSFLADVVLFMKAGSNADIGNVVKSAIHDYWHKLALKQAELEYKGEFCNEN